MNQIPLITISDDEEFYRGTTLRYYYSDKNFYDYLLAHAPWENGMLLVNITQNDTKRGAVYVGIVPVDKGKNVFSVKKKDFQYTLGTNLENWFLVKE